MCELLKISPRVHLADLTASQFGTGLGSSKAAHSETTGLSPKRKALEPGFMPKAFLTGVRRAVFGP